MLTVRGLLLALSLTVSVPVAEPLADGLNVTLKTQLALRFSVVPQVDAAAIPIGGVIE